MLPFVFSLPVCLGSLSAVRGMFAFCVLLMAYQAGWAALHGGRGTGAGLEDENDVALYINTFLPFACTFCSGWRDGRSGSCSSVSAIIVGVAGVVSTMSRGGFIGLVAMGAVSLARSATGRSVH